jgi:hypothetical protein
MVAFLLAFGVLGHGRAEHGRHDTLAAVYPPPIGMSTRAVSLFPARGAFVGAVVGRHRTPAVQRRAANAHQIEGQLAVATAALPDHARVALRATARLICRRQWTKRYALGTKNKSLKNNPDGSLTIYLGNKSPGKDRESNWLPAPEGKFSVWLRTYWPDQTILNGTWKPPVGAARLTGRHCTMK